MDNSYTTCTGEAFFAVKDLDCELYSRSSSNRIKKCETFGNPE